MSGTYEIQVRTIYSADDAVSAPTWRLRVLGLLTLVVASGWLYVTWQPMHKWVQQKHVLGQLHVITGLMDDMPKATHDGDAAAPQRGKKMTAQARKRAAADRKALADEKQVRREDAASAAELLAVAAYGWLTMMSLVGLWLVIGGAAGMTSASWAHTVGALLVPASLLAAGALAWYVWAEYEWLESLMPSWVIPTMGLLAALFAGAIGALVNRHAVGLLRAGGWLVVFSAVLSVIAIWLAVRWGQMPADQVDFALYAKVFGAQSAYGWILLLGTMGMR